MTLKTTFEDIFFTHIVFSKVSNWIYENLHPYSILVLKMCPKISITHHFLDNCYQSKIQDMLRPKKETKNPWEIRFLWTYVSYRTFLWQKRDKHGNGIRCAAVLVSHNGVQSIYGVATRHNNRTMDVSWLMLSRGYSWVNSTLAPKFEANVESSEKLIIRVEFLLVSWLRQSHLLGLC